MSKPQLKDKIIEILRKKFNENEWTEIYLPEVANQILKVVEEEKSAKKI